LRIISHYGRFLWQEIFSRKNANILTGAQQFNKANVSGAIFRDVSMGICAQKNAKLALPVGWKRFSRACYLMGIFGYSAKPGTSHLKYETV
jgi:hypothetical protein